eukprot:7114367-Alexandrium_andersonii.AAC.1
MAQKPHLAPACLCWLQQGGSAGPGCTKGQALGSLLAPLVLAVEAVAVGRQPGPQGVRRVWLALR